MPKIDENPNSIYTDIKNLLLKAVKDRSHPYHTPVFNNTSIDNITESRIVVLRKFNEKKLILNFHTDYRSPKIQELNKNNKSSFLFYDTTNKIQLRIKTVSKINNQNDLTKKAWGLTKLPSRKCYLTNSPPSSETDKAEDGIPIHLKGIDPKRDESEIGYKNFTVVENQIKIIDWLHLASSGHRRLKIDCQKKIIKFVWLIP